MTYGPARLGQAELFTLLQGRAPLSFDVSRFWDSDGYFIIEMIEPNHAFGWSALAPPHEMTLAARCVGRCTILMLPREDLLALPNWSTSSPGCISTHGEGL